jgi:iron(III) transport system substrate-binding protein
MFSAPAQQMIVDVGGLRSVHPHTSERPGRKPLAEIKTMKDDPAAVERESDDIKARYIRIFRV